MKEDCLAMKQHQHQYVCHAGEMIPSPLLSCFRQGLGCRNHFSRVRNLLLCLCRVIKIKNLPSYSEAYMRWVASLTSLTIQAYIVIAIVFCLRGSMRPRSTDGQT
ncbi:hypothetical protein CUMW_035690 [Citrus unshiu]|nr:hypothetical protein CUMW_035690 [Citrus unshiu]